MGSHPIGVGLEGKAGIATDLLNRYTALMDHIDEFVDERQAAWCIHCTTPLGTVDTNRDHVPSKAILLEPYPENLPVVQVCKSCNEGFSQDEEYLSTFLGCVISGSTDPERQTNPRISRMLTRSPSLQDRIERAKSGSTRKDGIAQLTWAPERPRVERVIVKNSRGHVLFELGEPKMDRPSSIWFAPLTSLTPKEREDFETIDIGSGWPEVGSRMMRRLLTGQDMWNGWLMVQDDVYRYAVSYSEGFLVRSVLFDYLATEVRWNA